MPTTQISVVIFKRKSTPVKADGWERGIAFIRAGDVAFIIDKEGKKIPEPHDWLVRSNEGSFVTNLEN